MRADLMQFYDNEVAPRVEEIRVKLQAEYNEKYDEWKGVFLSGFELVCKNANEYCKELSYEPAYLIFHVLRTRILTNDFRYQVRMYNKECYLEDGVSIGDYDVTFIYSHYENLRMELEKERLRYVGKIRTADIQSIMMEVMVEFHSFIVRFLRSCIKEATKNLEYQELTDKGVRLEIKTGEFLEIGDFIYIDDRNREKEKLIQWLDEQNPGDEYTFEDFRGIILKDKQYKNLDLRYADFSEGQLENVAFCNCKLEGACFDGCNLDAVRFE